MKWYTFSSSHQYTHPMILNKIWIKSFSDGQNLFHEYFFSSALFHFATMLSIRTHISRMLISKIINHEKLRRASHHQVTMKAILLCDLLEICENGIIKLLWRNMMIHILYFNLFVTDWINQQRLFHWWATTPMTSMNLQFRC